MIRMNLMKKAMTAGICAAVIAGFAANASAVTLVEWNFNDSNNIPDGGVLAATGSIALVDTTATYAGGSINDPAAVDQALNTTSYPAQGNANKSEGVRFNVSTAGYNNIIATFDVRHSNTASRYLRAQYTIDGSTWVDADQFMATAGDTWFTRTVDLSAIAGVNDNPNFGFRVVTEFAPSTTTYLAANPGSTYSNTGTLRYDLVTVTGTVVPEPGSVIAIATGLSGLIALRRRK